MDRLTICDLELHCCIGVPPEERAQPQRLLVSIELEKDLCTAARSEKLSETIDYAAVAEDLAELARSRSWVLIETLAAEMAARILDRYQPESVTVEIQKFSVPQARYVSVRLTRSQPARQG